MPSSHTVRMIDNENGNGNGNGSRSGFTSSSMPAFWSPKATSKISSSAAMLRIYNACNGTYYFICYVCPPSLLHAVCVVRVWQQLSATRSCRNSSQQGQGRPSKAKASQAKPRQARPAGGSFSSDVFGIFLSCVSLALTPAPAYNSPPSDAKQPPVPSIAEDSSSFILKCDLEHWLWIRHRQ